MLQTFNHDANGGLTGNVTGSLTGNTDTATVLLRKEILYLKTTMEQPYIKAYEQNSGITPGDLGITYGGVATITGRKK